MSAGADFPVGGTDPIAVRAIARASSPVVLVTKVGAATGAKAAATALACAASEPDRVPLVVDFNNDRAPRSTLIATAGARALEERLVAHLPDARAASRGQVCQLTLPADPEGIAQVSAGLSLVRESTAVIHLPPRLLHPLLGESQIQPTAALLRADLATDRALTALAVRDLIDRGLRVAVLKHPLGWLQARAAVLGALPTGAGALPTRVSERLFDIEDKTPQQCYDGKDGSESDEQEPRAPGRMRFPSM